MTEEEAKAVAERVVARCRPTMRRVIGDRTPKQYDRADNMAAAITQAVKAELTSKNDN